MTGPAYHCLSFRQCSILKFAVYAEILTVKCSLCFASLQVDCATGACVSPNRNNSALLSDESMFAEPPANWVPLLSGLPIIALVLLAAVCLAYLLWNRELFYPANENRKAKGLDGGNGGAATGRAASGTEAESPAARHQSNPLAGGAGPAVAEIRKDTANASTTGSMRGAAAARDVELGMGGAHDSAYGNAGPVAEATAAGEGGDAMVGRSAAGDQSAAPVSAVDRSLAAAAEKTGKRCQNHLHILIPAHSEVE